MQNHVPEDHMEANIYGIDIDNTNFTEQLFEQQKDAIIRSLKLNIETGVPVQEGQLKRVAKQLRIEHGILTKNGRPILQPSLRQFVISEMHRLGHCGIEKVYSLLKQRFYWPRMCHCLSNHVTQCMICNQCKVDSPTPKAPLVPICESLYTK